MKLTRTWTYLAIMLMIYLFACEQERNEGERSHAILSTRIEKLNSQGVTLSGSFLSMGKREIEEFGFIVGDSAGGEKFRIKMENPKEEFSCLLNWDITRGQEYSAKSYAISQGYSSYGNIVSFISEGFVRPDPVVTSFSPGMVTDGSVICLIGSGFSRWTGIIQVLTEDITCEVLFASQDTVIFTVPPLDAGEKTFHLRIGDKETEFGPIMIHAPVIDEIYPGKGYDGDVVTIRGDFLPGTATVYFGDNPAEILDSTENFTSLVVRSPSTEIKGAVEIIVNVSEKRTTSTGSYEILSQQISKVTPKSSKPGEVVSIHGSGFIQNDRTSSVFFNGVPARILEQDTTVLKAYLPSSHIDDPGCELTVSNGKKEVSYAEFTRINSWTKIQDFPGSNPNIQCVSVSLNSKGYLGISRISNSPLLSPEWWEFDPVDQSWTRKADYPGDLYGGNFVSFAIADRIYVLKEYEINGYPAYDMWSYEPAIDAWELNQKPPGGYTLSYYASTTCMVHDGEVYIFTYDRLLIYNPLEDEWEERSYPGTRRMTASVQSQSRLFFISANVLFEYHPGSDSWTDRGSLAMAPANGSVVFSFRDKLYFGGGSTTNGRANSPSFYEFDPISMDPIEREDFYRMCAFQSSFSIGEAVYVGMGIDNWGQPQNDFWIFDP